MNASPTADLVHRTPAANGLAVDSRDDWRDVCLGILRESGQGALHAGGLRRIDPLLH